MIYFIRCQCYRTGRWLLDRDLKDHKEDLSIRRVDLGRLMVALMNGDQIHYVPDCAADRWFIGRRSENLIKIRSLGELVKMKKTVSDEMLMLYIWEGVNEALGSDPTEVTHVAEFIYIHIKKRLEKENVIGKIGVSEANANN